MLSANDVARYFLATQEEDAGEFITNLKLQKLCYYAQGFHLALFDTPLFPESVKAWKNGPVVEELWRLYHSSGDTHIPRPTDVDFAIYDVQTTELLDEVHTVYGQFSAWKLRRMAHEEPPWRDAQATGAVITHEAMKHYFKTLVK